MYSDVIWDRPHQKYIIVVVIKCMRNGEWRYVSYTWFRALIAWEEKLLLILSVLGWNCFPDFNSEKSPLSGWERSFPGFGTEPLGLNRLQVSKLLANDVFGSEYWQCWPPNTTLSSGMYLGHNTTQKALFSTQKTKAETECSLHLQIELSGSPADVIIDSSIISSVVLMVLNMFITKQNKK